MANRQVDPAGRVLLLRIADGQEQGQDSAPGSGQALGAALGNVMASHSVPISASATSSLTGGLEEAQRAGYRYALKGTITLWEDNATAWSGSGDRLSIYLELYDARSRELVAAATHKRVASPDRFMDEVASGALERIYGWTLNNGATSIKASSPREGQSKDADLQPPSTDADAMNAELRRLAKDSIAHGDQKAAKDYLDMIVPAASQH